MAESLASMTAQSSFPFGLQDLLQAFFEGFDPFKGDSRAAMASTDGQSPILRLIAGDASDRKFFRLENTTQPAICMQFPKWEGGYGGDPLSWLGMHAALKDIGMPVPEVLLVDEANACIWTEDFGDDFLNVALQDRVLDMNDPHCQISLSQYEKALALLVEAQYPRKPTLAHPALERAFDYEKLHFEMKFFLKHFLGGFLGIEMAGATQREKDLRRAAEEDLSELCAWLENRPRVLCHRDYHLRNVMINNGVPKWIDFQDARMGPHSYDVVSLVRDSYSRITDETRRHLFTHYFALVRTRMAELGLDPLVAQDFELEVLHMGLQRNIKALGSFGYLATEKKKPSYLKYVPHTLEVLLARDSRVGRQANVEDEYPALFALLESLHSGELSKTLQTRLKEFQVEPF
jgi:N-acetylmuramate 1-kinase